MSNLSVKYCKKYILLSVRTVILVNKNFTEKAIVIEKSTSKNLRAYVSIESSSADK